MCRACLRSKPLRSPPLLLSQIYNNIPDTTQSQAGDLHLESRRRCFFVVNSGAKSAAKPCNSPAVRATNGAASCTAGIKKTFFRGERKEGKISQTDEPRWGGGGWRVEGCPPRLFDPLPTVPTLHRVQGHLCRHRQRETHSRKY